MSSNMFGSSMTRNDYEFGKMETDFGPDADKIKSILDEVYEYSKKEILKIKKNLDVLYGANSNEKNNGINKLYKLLMFQITSFFKSVVMESDRDKNHTIRDIKNLLVEKEILEKGLQIYIPIDDHNDDNPLIDVLIGIEKKLKAYRKIKKERMAELNKIQEDERHICQILDEKPKYSGIKDIPSETLLESIKQHITDLKNTRMERQSIFLDRKTKIESLLNALEEEPNLEFDKMVLGDPKQFQLSKTNLDELEKLIKRLKDQTDDQKRMAMELRTKLSSLWDRLQIDVTYRECFVSTNKCFGKSVIYELRKEVERCEALKKENIKQFIEKLRDELNDLWIKCHFGERQKKLCHVYYNTEFNEHVMDLLDTEVENTKKFYNDNISIFNLINDREQLWNKMIMIQEQTKNPGRLWKNRGGQLLKEEKERKVIQKELPKVEKELKNLLQLYENREGKFFFYDDERLLDVIEKQWDDMKNNKKQLHQPKSKIQSDIKLQTPYIVTRNKRKMMTNPSDIQASKVNKIGMDHRAVKHLESKKLEFFTSPTTSKVLRKQNTTFTTPKEAS